MTNPTPAQRKEMMEAILSGDKTFDILCVEGSILRGPGGTGMYDVIDGVPKKNFAAQLAKRAQYVLAVGTCACFGGFGYDQDTQASGLQFHRNEKGGLLGKDFLSLAGFPVINLAGCPCHPDVFVGTLMAIFSGVPIPMNELNMPLEWFGMLVHQGCTRNEYHEYRVEENVFGERGCLFFHMGCHGPLAYGPCNKRLWNRRNSKTRIGVPCFGCTRPDFPPPYPFFKTRNIEGIPIELPDGINRPHYLAYKGIAAAAAPERLKERRTLV